jgi:hypothetical protein
VTGRWASPADRHHPADGQQPNSILRSAIAGQRIQATTTLHVSTGDAPLHQAA